MMRGRRYFMETEKLQMIEKRMMYIIPGMIFSMIGDYCIGIEPVDSYAYFQDDFVRLAYNC